MKRPKRKPRGKINLRKIRPTHVYSLPEIAVCLDFSLDTIRRWRRKGMPVLPDVMPYLVHGAELKGWLEERQRRRKSRCKPDEMFCMGKGCHTPRRPKIGSARIRKSNQRAARIEAVCEKCGTKISKGFAMSNLAAIEKTYAAYQGNIEDLDWRRNPLCIVGGKR